MEKRNRDALPMKVFFDVHSNTEASPSTQTQGKRPALGRTGRLGRRAGKSTAQGHCASLHRYSTEGHSESTRPWKFPSWPFTFHQAARNPRNLSSVLALTVPVTQLVQASHFPLVRQAPGLGNHYSRLFQAFLPHYHFTVFLTRPHNSS